MKTNPDHTAARPPPLRVLLVEDSAADLELCLQELQKTEFEIHSAAAATPQEFVERLRGQSFDLILADYQLPNWNALGALELLRKLRKDIPLVVLSGPLDDAQITECFDKGTADYIPKDGLARLPIVIRRVLRERRTREERTRFAEDRDRFFMLSLDLLCILGFDGRFQQMNLAWEYVDD